MCDGEDWKSDDDQESSYLPSRQKLSAAAQKGMVPNLTKYEGPSNGQCFCAEVKLFELQQTSSAFDQECCSTQLGSLKVSKTHPEDLWPVSLVDDLA